MNNKGPGSAGGNMPTPGGMPSPTPIMDMNQMNQFQNGMMMPNQMGFPNQQMFGMPGMDPNFLNQMQYYAASQPQDGNQQFPQMMPGGNQFMQMNQPMNHM